MTDRLHTSTRIALVDAGVDAADQIDVDTATADQIATRLAFPVASFDAEFQKLDAFFEALQLRFLDGRLNRVIGDAGHLPPGTGRIRAAWSAYLDYTLEQAALYALCRKARRRFPSLRGEVVKRNGTVWGLLNVELVALKVETPAVIAKLATAMVFEIAQIENEERRACAAARAALWQFIESRIP
jgi:AcrR family transcriptional regulator